VPWEEIPLRALRAGVDLLLICHHRQRQEQAYARVLSAVQSSELPETIVDCAVARLQRLKSRLCRLLQKAAPPATLACIGSIKHRAVVETILERPARQAVERHPHGG
jgi:beta-N-acetylhexosaminidase